MEHERLVKIAVDAIGEVFSGKSVTPGTTKGSLEELQGEIDLLLDCLAADEESQLAEEIT